MAQDAWHVPMLVLAAIVLVLAHVLAAAGMLFVLVLTLGILDFVEHGTRCLPDAGYVRLAVSCFCLSSGLVVVSNMLVQRRYSLGTALACVALLATALALLARVTG